jgi:hypothetical protein
VDTSPVHELIAVNGHSLRFKYRGDNNRGKPTRSARLYLIYRRIEHIEMREFLKAEIKASLRLFDFDQLRFGRFVRFAILPAPALSRFRSLLPNLGTRSYH